MPIRPLAPFNVRDLINVEDALAMLDANIDDLSTMCSDQSVFGPKELWMLDKNIIVLKGYCDRTVELIQKEAK